jgi:excisionase family DNA binding protein
VTSTSDPDWLNLSQAAEILGVHPSTLRAWADKGDIPAHRTPGKHRRFRRAEIETWAAARRDAKASFSGQLIIQNTLGRTRLQMAEGRLNTMPWYQRLDEGRKREFREAGRRLLAGLMHYLDSPEEDAGGEDALTEAEAVGQTYARLGQSAEMALSETIALYLYFRDFLYESVVDVYQASGQRAPREWAEMHRRTTRYTNAVLLALVKAAENARKEEL